MLGGRSACRAAQARPVPAHHRWAGGGNGGAGGGAWSGNPGGAAGPGCGAPAAGSGGSVMEQLTWLLTAMLGKAARLLPPVRRQWAEAVWAEAGQVPSGWPRLRWLAGGLWLAVGEGAQEMVGQVGYPPRGRGGAAAPGPRGC